MSDIVENIGFEFDNKSNFDIRKKELDHVTDIPVFPAQNLILDTQTVNIYDRPDKSPVFIYDDKIYMLLSPHEDQRFVFLEYSEDSRLLDYRFGGRVYAQSRDKAAFSLTPDSFYVWAGNVGDKDDMRDLWRYDLATKTWVPEFITGEDLSISDFPSNRRNSNLVVAGTEKIIFGGETYIELGDNVIRLNDLWWFDGTSWKVLDPQSKLPHTNGSIVAFDSYTITIVADNKIWTVYKDGITDTTEAIYGGSSIPKSEYVLSFYHDGKIHYCDFQNSKIYEWNSSTSTLDVVKNSFGVGYESSDIAYYVTGETVKKNRGGDSEYQPEIKLFIPSILNWIDDTINTVCDIDAVPLGEYMATCDILDGKKYLGLGIRETTFIEDHYIWDGEKNNCYRIGSDSVKPQERMAAGSCYDKTRNRIWIFGGYTGSIYYNDLWYLSLDDYTWTRVRRRTTDLTDGSDKIWPAARAKSGMCVVEDTLWIVSGYSDVKSYSDMWKYDITQDFAEEEKLTDWVAFGSDYFLFEWRDRMWLFNGEYKLYRYFYVNKQFAPVNVYATRYPEIEEKIEGREYITPPMRLSVQGNNLIISYEDPAKGNWVSFFIDLDNKEIIQYPGDINAATFWYNQARGMDSSGYLYFYNVSPFEFAQRNTYPYYEYSIDPLTSDNPISRGSSLMMYWDEETVGGGVARLSYVDANSMYVIYNDQVEYSPIFPTFGEMSEGLLTNYWPQTDYSVIDGSEGTEQIENKISTGQGRFRSVPRFLWKRLPSKYADLLRKSSLSWQDESSNRTYVVNNQDGHILRYRAKDGTFFNYPSNLWPESTVAHRGNVVFALCGNNQQENTPPGLGQNGLVETLNTEQKSILGDYSANILCHNGIMMYDLNYMAFQLRMIADHDDLEPRDYDTMRDYLVDIARSQLNVNVTGEELNEDWIDTIKDSVYSDTISLVGDLSVRNIINEQGDRPFGPRCACLATQISSDIYFGGGAIKWDREIQCPCNPQSTCQELKYSNFYPKWDDDLGKYVKEYYKDFYKFDSDQKSWTKLSDLPFPLYGATVIPNRDETKIYVVGGYTENDLTEPSTKILVYDIGTDDWSELGPVPVNYTGRALPLVEWIDEDRMIIMFGNASKKHSSRNKYIRIPIGDAWLVDLSNSTMYKMFECQSKTSMILESMNDQDGYIHLLDLSRIWFSNIYDNFNIENGINQTLVDDKTQDIDENDPNEIFNEESFNIDETPKTPSVMVWSIIDPVDGQIKKVSRIEVPDTLARDLSPESIIKDFVDTRGDLWFIVNQTVTQLDDNGGTSNSQNMYFYRAAKNNDYSYTLMLLPVDVPLDLPVKLAGYDGTRYLYAVWNEFNIWQLDLETAIFNPNAEYWRRMPPYPDLADFGLWDSDSSSNAPSFSELVKSEPYGDDILFYHADGLVLRFDPYNFVWNIDRYPNDSAVGNKIVVKDGEELYYYVPGSVYGTLIGLEHKQEDKFYFDAELLESSSTLEIPTFDTIIEDMDTCISNIKNPTYDQLVNLGCSANLANKIISEEKLPSEIWESLKSTILDRRSTVKRNRIITWNKNNHMMRAWTKKHGNLDLYLQFDSYFPCERVELSVDYDTMNEQADRYQFTCWTDQGIYEGVGTAVQNDTGYDWDSFARNYRKLVPLGDSYTYTETERPGYMVRFALPTDVSINKLRLRFEPLAYEWNYTSKLNHVYVEHESDTIRFEDDDGPVSVMHIEPFEGTESDIYQIRIANNHPTSPANNVKVQLVNNYRVLLSLDNITWKRATIDDPLDIAQQMDPGEYAVFYLKALSYFDKSNLNMVVRSEYAPV